MMLYTTIDYTLIHFPCTYIKLNSALSKHAFCKVLPVERMNYTLCIVYH